MAGTNEETGTVDAMPVLMVAIERATDRNSNEVRFDFFNVDSFNDTAVGGRARGARKSKGWTKRELARKAGVEVEWVRLFERQPWAVPLRVISAIAGALGVTPNDLADAPTITFKC